MLGTFSDDMFDFMLGTFSDSMLGTFSDFMFDSMLGTMLGTDELPDRNVQIKNGMKA